MVLVIPHRAGTRQGLRGGDPEGQGSQQGVDPVIPCGAGAWQGLRGRGLERWGFQRGGGGCPRPGTARGAGILVMCGSGTELWPVQPNGQRVQQSRAAALQAYGMGTWQAGCSIR
jgi:hypothetical protein